MKTMTEIGSTPTLESCAQVGEEDYERKARKEIRAFCSQIRRMHGAEPGSALLVTKQNPHDFGPYYEAAVQYDDEAPAEVRWATAVVDNLPAEWDDQAKKELGLEKEDEDAGDPVTPEPWVRECFRKAGADPKKSEPQIQRVLKMVLRLEKEAEAMRQLAVGKDKLGHEEKGSGSAG